MSIRGQFGGLKGVGAEDWLARELQRTLYCDPASSAHVESVLCGWRKDVDQEVACGLPQARLFGVSSEEGALTEGARESGLDDRLILGFDVGANRAGFAPDFCEKTRDVLR